MDMIWIALITAAVVAVIVIFALGRGGALRRQRRMPRPSDPPSPDKRQW
ncbi:hypothetical protein [Glycocaulis sp.]